MELVLRESLTYTTDEIKGTEACPCALGEKDKHQALDLFYVSQRRFSFSNLPRLYRTYVLFCKQSTARYNTNIMNNDSPWWLDAKIYELYIDKFAGNLQGLSARLPYFKRLGINTLHLLPHYPSPMVDQGYDITDFRGVRPELGTVEDLRRFIEMAHTENIRIILDFVVNHVSDQHPWFLEARSSKDNPKRNFFLWSDTPDRFSGGINAFSDIKQSNWIWNEQTKDFYYATFYPQQPDLNWDNEEVVQEMFGAMDFLVSLGVDGFRIDAAPMITKREGTKCMNLPETHTVFKRMRARLESKHPSVALLAEAWGSVAELKTYFGEGDEFHMVYHFPLMRALWQTLLLGDRSYVDRIVAESADIPTTCQWATFLRNHDDLDVRALGPDMFYRIIDIVDPKQEYVFNHATTTSVRLATAFQGDTKKIIQAFELLYSLPGAPVCYYGDEIGMTNLSRDPKVVDTRVCVRGPLDWSVAEQQMSDPDSLFSKIASTISTFRHR
jgi:maltose alpha-D-glucosyltransferase/alpha-amylase